MRLANGGADLVVDEDDDMVIAPAKPDVPVLPTPDSSVRQTAGKTCMQTVLTLTLVVSTLRLPPTPQATQTSSVKSFLQLDLHKVGPHQLNSSIRKKRFPLQLPKSVAERHHPLAMDLHLASSRCMGRRRNPRSRST